MKHSRSILIIEDEFIIALNLKKILIEEGYSIVGIANTYEESIDLCKQHHPEIAIVDINIEGNKDGIETAAFINELFNTSIIFLTAYTHDDYFERAKLIQPEAYLTKPFKNEEVVRTIKLLDQKLGEPSETMSSPPQSHIILNTGDGWHKVLINDIIHVSSDNNYCTFTMDNGSEIMVNQSLKNIETTLSAHRFYRCHQRHLINMNHLIKLEKKDGFRAIMKGPHIIPIARNRKPELMELFLN